MTQNEFERILQKLLGLVRTNDLENNVRDNKAIEEEARNMLEEKLGCPVKKLSSTNVIEKLKEIIESNNNETTPEKASNKSRTKIKGKRK